MLICCVLLQTTVSDSRYQTLLLDPEAERLRWFLLPSEAWLHLTGSTLAPPTCAPPFQPRRYRYQEKESVGLRRLCVGSEAEGTGGSPVELESGADPGQQNGVRTEYSLQVEPGVNDGSSLPPNLWNAMVSAWKPRFHPPPKSIWKPTVEVCAAVFVNPRRTCAVRVTVLAMSVCLSVCYHSSGSMAEFYAQTKV